MADLCLAALTSRQKRVSRFGVGLRRITLQIRGDRPREFEALRSDLVSFRERSNAVEGRVAQGRRDGDDGLSAEDVDVGDGGDRHRPVVQAPRRVFPELIT